MKEKKHKSVILFSEWKKPLQALSLEQKGRLFDALLDFPDGVRPDFDDPLLLMAWAFMEGGLEENARKWDEIRERRAEAGRRGNEKRWHSDDEDSKNRKCDTCDNDVANIAVSGSGSGSGSENILSSSSSNNIFSPDDQTTTSIEDEFRARIGKLSETGKKELPVYVERLGADLVTEIIRKCEDLGGHSWAYVRKALAEAARQGCTSVEEYRKTNPIGAGRNLRVDRAEPSGNNFLNIPLQKNLRRLKKKGEESA